MPCRLPRPRLGQDESNTGDGMSCSRHRVNAPSAPWVTLQVVLARPREPRLAPARPTPPPTDRPSPWSTYGSPWAARDDTVDPTSQTCLRVATMWSTPPESTKTATSRGPRQFLAAMVCTSARRIPRSAIGPARGRRSARVTLTNAGPAQSRPIRSRPVARARQYVAFPAGDFPVRRPDMLRTQTPSHRSTECA